MLDFDFKAYERRKKHCFNGEQKKVIEMKGIVIIVKVDEMYKILKSVLATV